MIGDFDTDPSGNACPVMVYVSSDEDSPIVATRKGLGRARELLPKGNRGLAACDADNEDEDEEEDEDEDDDGDVVVIEFSPKSKLRKPKVGCDDDECLVLDGDPNKPVPVQYDPCDDVGVVAEKGQVACRDYPHARHDCAKFPFSTTPHEKHCDLYYCYVCDSLAPCTHWGMGQLNLNHCHANDKDEYWKACRQTHKMASTPGKSIPEALTTQMNGLKV